MRSGLLSAGVVLSCLLLFGAAALGQIITGTIDGTVRDESGAVLPGATVTITSPQLPAGPQTFVTDTNGRYRFRNLAPGAYGLTVELPGFGVYQEEGLRVTVGGNVERIVTMALASVAETITVTGESPIVDTRKSGVSTNYDSEFMENTPLRRFSMFDFTKSAPGMSATAPTRGTTTSVSAYGSGVDENTWLMDGTDFTAPVWGGAWPWPDTDVIEEIEIISLGASAEYQVAGGAVVNVVTKQGTNEFKWDAAYFAMPEAFTSKPIKEDCGCPDGETGFTRNKFHDATVHAGFPIIQDKMWLYGGYQFQRDYDNQPGTDPRFPRQFEADRIYWKYTWQITENIKFMHTYHDDYWVIPQTPSISRPFETILTFGGRNPSVTFGDITHVLSGNTFYDLRASGFYSPNDYADPNGNFGQSRRTDVGTGLAQGGPPFSGGFRQARTAVNGKLSHYAADFLGGDHDFKFGVQWVEGSHSGHYGYTNDIIYYDYNSEPYYAYMRERYNYGGKFRDVGMFAEDMIHLGDRATLQIGVRYDRITAFSQDIPSLDQDRNEIGSIAGAGELYTNNNISPRFGFNIKLDDVGKTILRGNWGLYYRQPITGELAIVHPGWTELTVAFFDPPPGMGAVCAENRTDGSLAPCYSDVAFTFNPLSDVGIDSTTQSPRTSQFSIGVDREISPNIAVGFTYVRKDGSQYNGWLIENAAYEPGTATLEDGRQIDVFNITTDPSDRFFNMGPQSRFFMDYDGIQVQLKKRWSNNWQALIAYNWSDGRGLLGSNAFGPASSQTTRVFGSSIGKDPNDYTNATGNLLNDRTHMFQLTGAWEVPGVGVMVAGNWRYYTGKPWASQGRVRLPQGSRNVYLEPLGERRLSSLTNVDFRLSKVFRFGDTGKVEFLADFLNLTNSTTEEDIVTRNFFSGNFGVGDRWVDPRRVMIGVKIAQ